MPAHFVIRNRYFAVPGILSIALGIAACVFVFTLVKAVLLTPLPYDEAERLVLLRSRNVRLGETRPFVSPADFRDWRDGARSFESMALFHWTELDLLGEEAVSTERVQGLRVTPEFFSVMGLSSTIGQVPEASRSVVDADVIVLGRDLWKRRFGGDADLVSEAIGVGIWRSPPRVGSVPYRVAAVVDEPSRFLPMSTGLGRDAVGVDDIVDFWIPFRIDDELILHREFRDIFGAVARLEPDVSREQAQAELEAVAARLAAQYPDTNANWTVELVPLGEAVTGTIRPVLGLLSVGVFLLFLIACSNAASLGLVRTIERRRELAVRRALGASGFRLVRQIMTETVSVAAWGGALGVGLAVAGLRGLETIAPRELPRVETLRLDPGVVVFAVALVLTAGFLAGCGPAWLLARRPDWGLESGFRTANAGRESRRPLQALAVIAVGMALVLLIGAGLVHQSLSRLLGVDPGYDRDNLLTLTVSLPAAKYPWRRNTELVHELIDRLSGLPGVVAAGAVRGPPGRETRIEAPLFLPGRTSDPLEARPRVQIRLVSPTYFEVMGVPTLAGRGFEPRDERGEIGYTKVVLVNATMADRIWPGESAIGKTFGLVRSDLPPVEIIGVVGDVRYRGLEHPPGMEVYYPEALFPQAQADLILRTETPPLELSALVQAEIRAIAPDVLIFNVGSMNDVLQRTVADRHFASWLLTGFSSTALLLAAVGMAGVIAQNMSQRRKELGVRLALGARPGSIIEMVLLSSLLLTGVGVGLGIVAAVSGAELLSRFLFAIEPTDPATYVTAALVTVSAATLASLIPAWRAAATDPLRVLRED